jgi:hypothetical protein
MAHAIVRSPELVELFATPSILERRPDEAFKQRLAASTARNRDLLDGPNSGQGCS